MKVYVSSVGFTSITDHWGASLLDLAVEASMKALKGTTGRKPQQIFVGNMFSALGSKQEQLGALVAASLGLRGVPAVKIEAAGASGAAAFSMAYSLVKSGAIDSALVVGVEKMRDMESEEVASSITLGESSEYTQFVGASFAAINGLLARYYMEQLNVTRDELSSFPVIDHANAVSAAHAQFRRAITPEVVARSSIVADPLRLFDCAPVGDGAAAVVLVSDKAAAHATRGLVEVLGSAISTDEFNFYEREDMLAFQATRTAFRGALKQAGLAASKLDFVEIHDAYSVMGALSLEAMGLSKKGESALDARQGRYDLNSELSINTFGGLKARGHPVGATAVYQIAEAYMQLTEGGGQNQVKGAEYGATHSVGGIDTTTIVHVFGRAG
jgi:acetyl-CoA C-acetyltransferase